MRHLHLSLIAAAAVMGACGSRGESPSGSPMPVYDALDIAHLRISSAAASVIIEHTGDVKNSAALTDYLNGISAEMAGTPDARVVRVGNGIVVVLPTRGFHSVRATRLGRTLHTETGLMVFVLGHSVFYRGSIQCNEATAAASNVHAHLRGAGVFATRVWSVETCDQIPSVTFDNPPDPHRDERVEVVIYPSRSLIKSLTKANGAPAQRKN